MDLSQRAAQLLQPEAYGNPEEVDAIMTQMRKEEPVVWVEPEGVRPLWVASRAEDVKFIETNPEKFIAGPRPALMTIEQEQKNIEIFGRDTGPIDTLVQMDGEYHKSRRALTQQWFRVNRIKADKAFVDGIAKTFVDRMAAMQPGCDFAKDVAFLYPLRVINAMTGLPEELDPTILKLTQQNFGGSDDEVANMDEEFMARMAATMMEFQELFAPIIKDRRENPRDDLATALANATIDGEPLPDMEIMGYFVIVATAGHDTTSASTAGGLLELIRHPDQLQLLKDKPELIPNAVEEFFRWVAPVKHFFRTATEDVEVGGKMIRKGETIAPLFASACRDEAVFEDPFTFNIERKPNRHLAFGTGPHLCLGMHLAKLEITSFFTELLPRLDSIELDGDPAFLNAAFVTGVKSMPIKFSMR